MIKLFFLYGEVEKIDAYIGKLVFFDNGHPVPGFHSYQYLHFSVNGMSKPWPITGICGEPPNGLLEKND